MKWALLFIGLITRAFCEYSFDPDGVILPDQEDFKLRQNTLKVIQDDYLFWSSLSTQTADVGGTVDAIAAAVASGHVPPTIGLAYFQGKAQVEEKIPDFNLDTGVMLLSFIDMREIDEDGDEVEDYDFYKINAWSSDEWKLSGRTEIANGVNAFTLKGFDNMVGDTTANIHVITSEKIGLLKYSNGVNAISVPVTPKGLEMLVEVNGYNYKKAGNRLQLRMGAATISPVFGKYKLLKLAAKAFQGNGNVYVTFAETASIDGSTQNVTVSDLFDNTVLETGFKLAMKALSASQADVQLSFVSVNFPPGAQNILYDPIVGQSLAGATDGAATLSCMTIVALFILFVSLFN